jgi:predicted transcriptional regulator
LRVVYEDGELVVCTGLGDDELVEVVRGLLSARPMTLHELHSALAGSASVDRVRRSLRELIRRGEVYVSSRVRAWVYSTCTRLGGGAGSL